MRGRVQFRLVGVLGLFGCGAGGISAAFCRCRDEGEEDVVMRYLRLMWGYGGVEVE